MIYRQERVGRHGRVFSILKIETMRDGVVTRPRLRRWGLDELPQIVNVLRGEMALVGPRPEIPEIHDRCSRTIGQAWDDRLRAKPGLLSLASVALPDLRSTNRYDAGVKVKQAVLDNLMIESGAWGKLRVLLKLPRALLRGQRTEGGCTHEALHAHPAGLPADRPALH